MSARDERGILTIYNIAGAADDEPLAIFEEIQGLIDAADYDIPDAGVSAENVVALQKLQAYYSNQYPYLVGLWGAMKAVSAKDPQRIAIRDYLEKAVSACSKKYDAASRLLTGYSLIVNENRGERRI